MTRRRLLGGLALGGGGAGLLAALRDTGGYAPKAKPVEGTGRVVERYGDGAFQQGEWWVPPAAGDRLPIVVLVHGGYWNPGYDRSLEDAVAADLSGRGFLCWNIDYAAADVPWPATLTDVAGAYDHLAASRFRDRLDPARVSVVGHSAGGHLALWLARRPTAFAAKPGVPRPAVCIGQAPVAALADGARARLGGGAVTRLLGGSPDDVPDRYAQADPVALLPTGVPTVVVHSAGDAAVPIAQSETYLAAATAKGDPCRLERVGGDHYAHLDPASEACARMRAALS